MQVPPAGGRGTSMQRLAAPKSSCYCGCENPCGAWLDGAHALIERAHLLVRPVVSMAPCDCREIARAVNVFAVLLLARCCIKQRGPKPCAHRGWRQIGGRSPRMFCGRWLQQPNIRPSFTVRDRVLEQHPQHTDRSLKPATRALVRRAPWPLPLQAEHT